MMKKISRRSFLQVLRHYGGNGSADRLRRR